MTRSGLLLLALALPTSAEPARILSGEHGSFTRLVVELPGAPEWTVGRTPEGYAFAARTATQPDYDLTSVWKRIPRTRLANLAVDPSSGALILDLGCECHVFPFEYDDGIVVLDIREGDAPTGSIFEAPFRSTALGTTPRGDTGAYDWLADLPSSTKRAPPALPLPLDTGAISLEPLRNELLEQIAKGAADGVIDMELPPAPLAAEAVGDAELPWSHIRVGEQAGLVVTTPSQLVQEKTPDHGCPSPELLDIGSWGQGEKPLDILAKARDGLYGEFDIPVEESILRSASQLLFLGFGVEAGQTLDLLPPTVDDEIPSLYRSMARIVDGDSDPDGAFSSMLDCDGPAALWAALSLDRLPLGPVLRRDAILQAFQGLPAHLKRHLGPGLAEKFLGRDDSEAARIIRDAIGRAPEADPGSLALLDAKANLHGGDIDAAQTHAETAVALEGDSADSLVTLVEAHFRKLQPLDRGIPEALQGLRSETDASRSGPSLERAIVLSLALSEQTEAAFAERAAAEVLPDLWKVVAVRASDDDFLRKAVLAQGTSAPDVARETAVAVGERLLALGFPDAALVWLAPVTSADPPELRLAAAEAELRRGDARAAVALLEGVSGPEAETQRARALLVLGDLPAAQNALASAGDTEGALRVELWEGDWTDLNPQAPDPWLAAADQAQNQAIGDDVGTLGRGSKSVEASLASRAAIEALLDSVPTPDGG